MMLMETEKECQRKFRKKKGGGGSRRGIIERELLNNYWNWTLIEEEVRCIVISEIKV